MSLCPVFAEELDSPITLIHYILLLKRGEILLILGFGVERSSATRTNVEDRAGNMRDLLSCEKILVRLPKGVQLTLKCC